MRKIILLLLTTLISVTLFIILKPDDTFKVKDHEFKTVEIEMIEPEPITEPEVMEEPETVAEPINRYEEIKNMTDHERSLLSQEEKDIYGISDEGYFYTEDLNSSKQIEMNN